MTRTSALIVPAVGLIAIAGVGFRAAPSTTVINFKSAPRAPKAARSAFARDFQVPKATLRKLELAQTRRIATEVFTGMSEQLLVAPATGGGFCYEWAEPTIWVTEFGGCSDQSRPMIVGYDDTRVNILANRVRVDTVRAKLSDGSEVSLNVRWVSAPISAGFVLYQPPKGLQVTEVDALKGSQVVETDPIKTP